MSFTAGDLKAIAVAGSVAGVLDLADAVVLWGMQGIAPIRVLQSIASGLLGSKAFSGGVVSAALGVLCHFFIALVAAAIYYFTVKKFSFINQRAFAAGVVFGMAVYVFMNSVVLPLSNFGGSIAYTPAGTFAHTLLFGVPIALIVRKYLRDAAVGS